jgi:hypothetical protein
VKENPFFNSKTMNIGQSFQQTAAKNLFTSELSKKTESQNQPIKSAPASE